MQRIDAHHHLWQRDQFDYTWLKQPDLREIDRDFLPADLQPQLNKVGIDKTVLVQTQHSLAENRWALSLTQEHPFIAGVVGWVDLSSERIEQHLEELLDHPRFVGVRHITQDEPDDNFIVRPDNLRGLAMLEQKDVAFDLLFYVKHLHHTALLADKFPNLRLVIDHLAKPLIKDHVTTGWEEELRRAAERPNVYCKLSGMVTEADWQHWQVDDLKPYVDIALECFGVDRLMFGSDWPVCRLAASYQQVHDALQTLLSRLSNAEQQAIFGNTASQFYRLG